MSNFLNCKIFIHILIIFLFDFHYVQPQDFSYDGNLGPDHWGEQYNSCDGKFQSPINIDILNVHKYLFPPLKFTNFNITPIFAHLQNNGHTVLITMDFINPPKIEGGPLNDSYVFVQMHYHWGDNDTFGSEDLINGHSFPVELHMVFSNTKYNEFSEATKHPDGLVVLAFFYELAKERNPHYREMLSLVDSIIEADSVVNIMNPPQLHQLMSRNLEEYFTYSGSLTTPPCSEVVQWIDFTTPIPISSQQINTFRHLLNHGNTPIMHNFRPIQPLNGRIVYYHDPKVQSKTKEDVLNEKEIISSEKETIYFNSFNDINTINYKSGEKTSVDYVEKSPKNTRLRVESSSFKLDLNKKLILLTFLTNFMIFFKY